MLVELLVDAADVHVDRGKLFKEGDLLADAHVVLLLL
jgi:hypothetical protein